MSYSNNETNPRELPQPGDVMIVDRELSDGSFCMFVLGVTGTLGGELVSNEREAERLIAEQFRGDDDVDVWYFVEHTGQREFWRYEWSDEDVLDAETIGCMKFHELRDEGRI